MKMSQLNLLLADDDADDCIFFKEALEELPVPAKLNIVNDGVQLMDWLSKREAFLPDVLYLDLNMPRKNGFDCLREIKLNDKFKELIVIIFSTSFDTEVVNNLRKSGANYYIRKPAEFFNLKKVIHKSLNLVSEADHNLPSEEPFVLTAL